MECFLVHASQQIVFALSCLFLCFMVSTNSAINCFKGDLVHWTPPRPPLLHRFLDVE